jgi:hypothetical protein
MCLLTTVQYKLEVYNLYNRLLQQVLVLPVTPHIYEPIINN